MVNRPGIEKTVFTEWMTANWLYEDARQLTFQDFPTKLVWHKKSKEWRRRKSGQSIGRIYYAHPSSGERFYPRMLLNIVKRATSFDEIKTVNGQLCPSFKAACFALGLLDGDRDCNDAIKEASNWATGQQVWELFVTILLFCEVSQLE